MCPLGESSVEESKMSTGVKKQLEYRLKDDLCEDVWPLS